MTSKICSTCKLQLDSTNFCKDTHRKDGLQNRCRACRAQYKKKVYPQSKEDIMERRKIRKRLLYLFIFQYLKEHPCIDCGENDPIVLDFDHVKGNKLNNVSTMAHDLRPLDVIKDEISKCEVRCSNCHRKKTAKEQNWYHYIDTSTMTLKKV